MVEYKKTSISIKSNQYKIVKDKSINLSAFVQKCIKEKLEDGNAEA